MVGVIEDERVGWVQSMLPYRCFWSTDCRLGVGNVVASMLNLTEGVVDVFENNGEFQYRQHQPAHYSTQLKRVLGECLSLDPSRRPDFPTLLKTTQEHRTTIQNNLRDQPANSVAWRGHELISVVTSSVRIRRLRWRCPRMN